MLFMFDPESALFPAEENYDLFLDRDSYVKMWIESLPHWEQEGKTQYVTFRLTDSLPSSKLMVLYDIRAGFAASHPELSGESLRKECRKLLSPRYNMYLDAGYGSCILRRPEIRRILSDSLEYNDGVAYDLLGYVVMPNHVHIVMRMLGKHEANDVMKSIKRFCTTQMNKRFNTGTRLFSENWDRLIRNESHLKYVLNYILNNPRSLYPDEYTLGGRIIKNFLNQQKH